MVWTFKTKIRKKNVILCCRRNITLKPYLIRIEYYVRNYAEAVSKVDKPIVTLWLSFSPILQFVSRQNARIPARKVLDCSVWEKMLYDQIVQCLFTRRHVVDILQVKCKQHDFLIAERITIIEIRWRMQGFIMPSESPVWNQWALSKNCVSRYLLCCLFRQWC